MIVRTLGAETLSRLIAHQDRQGADLSWLLSGPTDPAVVEEPDQSLPLAAE